MRFLFTLLIVILSFTSSFTQTGTIRGSVIEGKSGETVIGANVLVEGTESGTSTDLDGEFTIGIAPGTYNIQISYVGYKDLRIEGVVVNTNGITLLKDLQLSDESVTLQEVVVKADAIRTSESAILLIKKNAGPILDGISAARIQLTGDGTAVEAAKRVTGVSIENGKYVYVRGLGDRYTKTTLNGVDIPGLDLIEILYRWIFSLRT